MSGFTKLFSSIIHSTVWREAMHVKVVWITMLALADQQGEVQASIPGLADAARVSVEQCEDALACLSSPDPYSRTKDYEGRRITEIDGGWRLLNYTKHRDSRAEDVRRQQNREAQERYRQRLSDDVSRRKQTSDDISHGEVSEAKSAQAEAEAEAEETNTRPGPSDDGFEEWWARYPRKVAKKAASRAWMRLTKAQRRACMARSAAVIAGFSTDIRYQPHPATFLNQARWEDEVVRHAPKAVAEDSLEALIAERKRKRKEG